MPAKNPALSAFAAAQLASLGERLRQQRRSLKINATAAAEAAGVSRVTLHRIEKGKPSVTAGGYAAAAAALGLQLQVTSSTGPATAKDHKGWIPARIRLDDYPALKELAWQLQGTEALTPREALDIYERNWRHVDTTRLSDDEKDLVEALRLALAGANGV